MRKVVHGIVIALCASLVAMACWWNGMLDRWEFTTWSWRVKYFAQPSTFTPNIKLILIDQASLDWAAKENGLSWAWPRSVYVPVLDFCQRSGAHVVAFDMLYSEPGVSVEDDALFGDAIRKTTNYVGAFFMGQQAAQSTSWPTAIPKPDFPVQNLDGWLTAERRAALVEPRATFPILEVATNVARLASVKDEPDTDGVYRRVTPFRIFDGVAVPSLGLASFLAGKTSQPETGESIVVDDKGLFVGSTRIALDERGKAIPRFRGPSGTHQAFSAAAIIQSELRIEEGGEPVVSTNALRDCYVFFGVTAPGLKDLKSTPMAGDYPGVEIHATFLDNLLANDFLRDIPTFLVLLGTLIPALVAALLVLFSRRTWQIVVVFVVIMVLPWVRGYVAYNLGFWWPVIGPELAVGLSLVSSIVLSYATEGRQKRFIKSAFNQYVGEEVLDEMTRDPSKLRLGGEKKEITMFFSDLEKFSSFSERLDPPRLIELLNVYLTEMGQVIKQETGGYLDKFVGDAIVAFWNGPVSQPDHAVRAVRAAILCQRRLAEKRDEWAAQYNAVLKMRIGIGTGEVVVGNMGSKDKFNYTMLGDAANASSRLEGSNKAFGTYTMVADITWQQAQGAVIGRELGSIRVVGRKTPMKVYEPMALSGESLPAWVADFERGVALCLEKKWKDALAVFEKISDDHASQVYAQRCRDLISGTLKEWDGVWNLTEK